jgi:starch synthase (maltosyl-transferring)
MAASKKKPASKLKSKPTAKVNEKNAKAIGGDKSKSKSQSKAIALPTKTLPTNKTVTAKSSPIKKATPSKSTATGYRGATSAPKIEAIHTVVENLQPVVDGGRFPIKAIPGEIIDVTADIYRGGHEKCEAVLLFRKVGQEKWQRSPMAFVDNDGWLGQFTAQELGNYEYTVEARTLKQPHDSETSYVELPCIYTPYGTLRVDSPLTQFSAWYEMWAKSQGTDPNRSANFSEMTARLTEIKGLGFDVIYLPPIHPIGVTKRKGKNNSLTAKPGEPGCPYAIGNSHGGHKAVDPELGTLEECRTFIRTCQEMGFAVALDFALNCSPDHPYVKAHPDWFYREKDGTIKCAENPPKRYEDVYPLNFFCQDRQALWLEIKSIVEFWMEMGITIFRVDNPHTKPFSFWEWLITDIKKQDPAIAFLSEAFTRPKVMKRLAKIGFDLSYTYFTWRTTALELREYCEELTQGPAKHYMKPIFFPTTPDILPYHLQNAPPAAFKIRFALACTLSGAHGMYNGYEICENTPYPGKEEYLNSEKYQYKVWDWNKPGNIKDFISKLNAIRHENRALHYLKNLNFHLCNNPQILVYSKHFEENILLFVVNLDPENIQSGTVSLELSKMGLAKENIYGLYDLLTHESYVWSGVHNYVELSPQKEVMHIFKVEKF